MVNDQECIVPQCFTGEEVKRFKSVVAVTFIFGILHLESGRKYSFAACGNWGRVLAVYSQYSRGFTDVTCDVFDWLGDIAYTGVPRIRERPIADLVDGLKQLDAEVHCFLGTKCPPVQIVSKGGLPEGKVNIPVGRDPRLALKLPHMRDLSGLVDILNWKYLFLPLEWIGMNAMLVYVMAAAGIFAVSARTGSMPYHPVRSRRILSTLLLVICWGFSKFGIIVSPLGLMIYDGFTWFEPNLLNHSSPTHLNMGRLGGSNGFGLLQPVGQNRIQNLNRPHYKCCFCLEQSLTDKTETKK
ncbi:hypothetical protein FXO37_06275 [Capsicum annuum]|nr:hypothetical protein FXO37_06275 [Capsicum annuum]